MTKVGLLVRMEAKPGKEAEVEKFLQSALPLAEQEPKTAVWFAMKMEDSVFCIFDAFPDEEGRQAHLNGMIAAALKAHTADLLVHPPVIENVEVVAAKPPR